jgi:hypothetical protein
LQRCQFIDLALEILLVALPDVEERDKPDDEKGKERYGVQQKPGICVRADHHRHDQRGQSDKEQPQNRQAPNVPDVVAPSFQLLTIEVERGSQGRLCG